MDAISRSERNAAILQELSRGTDPETIASRYGLQPSTVRNFASKNRALLEKKKASLQEKADEILSERIAKLREKLVSVVDVGLDAVMGHLLSTEDLSQAADVTISLLEILNLKLSPEEVSSSLSQDQEGIKVLIQQLIQAPEPTLYPIPQIDQKEFSTKTIPLVLEGSEND